MIVNSFLSGPPIQIIPDYRERQPGGGTEPTDTPNMELEEDKAFATLLEDAGIGETGTYCIHVLCKAQKINYNVHA